MGPYLIHLLNTFTRQIYLDLFFGNVSLANTHNLHEVEIFNALFLSYMQSLPGEISIRAKRVAWPSNLYENLPAQLKESQQDILDRMNFPSELIPEDLVCPITRLIINGIPVFDERAPHRFEEKALITWLNKNNRNPITLRTFQPSFLKKDYYLANKISLFIKFCGGLDLADKSFFEQQKTVEKLMEFINEGLNYYGNLDNLLNLSKIQKRLEMDTRITLLLPLTLICMIKNVIAQTNSFQRSALTFFNNGNSIVNNKYNTSAYDLYIEKYQMTPQEALGITNASASEIRKAFMQRALKLHPDKNRNVDAVKEFHKIEEARNILLTLQDKKCQKENFYVYSKIRHDLNQNDGKTELKSSQLLEDVKSTNTQQSTSFAYLRIPGCGFFRSLMRSGFNLCDNVLNDVTSHMFEGAEIRTRVLLSDERADNLENTPAF